MTDLLSATLAIILVAPAAIPLLIWMTWIRPFLRRNGLTQVTGANWGQSAWGDWTLAREFSSKNNQEPPWFITAFPVSLLLWIICPAVAVGILNLLPS